MNEKEDTFDNFIEKIIHSKKTIYAILIIMFLFFLAILFRPYIASQVNSADNQLDFRDIHTAKNYEAIYIEMECLPKTKNNQSLNMQLDCKPIFTSTEKINKGEN